MGAPVALRLTVLTTLKHPMQLSDISRGICSLILGAMGHYQTAETSLLLHMVRSINSILLAKLEDRTRLFFAWRLAYRAAEVAAGGGGANLGRGKLLFFA